MLRYVHINEYLYNKGLITLTTHSQQVRERAIHKNMLRQTLKKAGLFELAKQIRSTLNTTRTTATRYDPHALKISKIIWEKTLAFVPSSSGFGSGYADIFLSPSMDAERIADLRADLLQQVDPATGKTLLEAAYTTEVFGTGSYAPGEPHLLLLPNDGITFRRGPGNPRYWDDAMMAHDPTRHSGVHQKDGILYVYGSAFKRGFHAPPAEIYDLVPTILRCMGLPLPTPCDGHVLEELFTKHQQEKQVISIKDNNTSLSQQKLKKLLEA
jgi:predicted AlkP superfamily phosphohydrolase/phosphomutase